jgi:predicted nucleic acid-binding protein
MIVLDASAAIELLLDPESGRTVASRIANPELGLHAPHLIDIEVAQVLRRHVQQGEVDPQSAKAALPDWESESNSSTINKNRVRTVPSPIQG